MILSISNFRWLINIYLIWTDDFKYTILKIQVNNNNDIVSRELIKHPLIWNPTLIYYFQIVFEKLTRPWLLGLALYLQSRWVI